nr:amino acid adenylation domain-containing protein [Chitinophaga rhizophila]
MLSLGIILKVVNGDLKISAPKGVLTPALLEEIRQHKTQLLHIMSSATSIPQAAEAISYPATSSQRRLWVLSKFKGANTAYNIVNELALSGQLDVWALEQALNLLIARHESLRTCFRETADDGLQQYILPAAAAQLQLTVTAVTPSLREELVQDCYAHVFDLSVAPLIHARLLQEHQDQHVLVLTLHHIISDGWSMEVFNRELIAMYQALKGRQTPVLPVLPIQFKDYAVWMTNDASQQQLQPAAAYWQEQLSGELPVLELPVVYKRPLVKTYNGASLQHTFSTGFSQQLTSYTRSRGATLFMGLMAGINGLFFRYTGQSDIILGTPVAGRTQPVLEQQIGLYLNTLAIRTTFPGESSFAALLDIQKNTLLAAYKHQDYPFDLLLDSLSARRDVSRSALFDVMVVLQNQPRTAHVLEDITITVCERKKRSSQFDITFSFIEDAGALQLQVEYNTDLYNEPFIHALVQHLEGFILSALANPEQAINLLEYLTPEERYTIPVLTPVNESHLVEIFEQQAARTPDATAVVYNGVTLTYRQLQERSSQLAHYLLQHYAIKSGDLAGVKVSRSEWLVISLLAVLKTGAAYVPVDLNYPEERIRFIEEDSRCAVVVTDDLILSADWEGCPATLPSVNITPEQAAYVIYTSGSTGRPKGVLLTHRNAVALLDWSKTEFASDDFDIAYAVTSHCFDLSVFEIFYPLSIGRRVRVLQHGLDIAQHLPVDTKVLINTVPSVINELLHNGLSFANAAAINMAGEPLPVALANALLPYTSKVRNLYGPSEDTTYSSCYRIAMPQAHNVPIGKPVSNTAFYILSPALKQQPHYVTGEICISGVKLSAGYLHRPELTAEKFVPNPYWPGQQMYRTGDLGYSLPDGNIVFAGRKDDQVKIRGHRIELGEIEYTLKLDPAVVDAAVLVNTAAAEPAVIAYIAGADIHLERLKSLLAGRLPKYMLPAAYVVLEQLPLTPNGKTDRKALLQLEIAATAAREYTAPVTALERELVEIWEQVLGKTDIGVTDDFFDLGGHSLKATSLLAIIHKQYGVSLDIQVLFQCPTIQVLADNIENARWLLAETDTNYSVKKLII